MLKPSLFASARAALSLSHAARGQGAVQEARPRADDCPAQWPNLVFGPAPLAGIGGIVPGAASLSEAPDARAGLMPARVARLPQPAGPGYHGPAVAGMRRLAERSKLASASLRF